MKRSHSGVEMTSSASRPKAVGVVGPQPRALKATTKVVELVVECAIEGPGELEAGWVGGQGGGRGGDGGAGVGWQGMGWGEAGVQHT